MESIAKRRDITGSRARDPSISRSQSGVQDNPSRGDQGEDHEGSLVEGEDEYDDGEEYEEEEDSQGEQEEEEDEMDENDEDSPKNSRPGDKILFFLYFIIFIFLTYSQVDIPLSNECFNSLKNTFNLTGIQRSAFIDDSQNISSLLGIILMTSQNNWIQQEKFQLISNIRINQRNFKLENITDVYFPGLNRQIYFSDNINFLAPIDPQVEEDYSKNTDPNFLTSPNSSYLGYGGRYFFVYKSKFNPSDLVMVKNLTDTLFRFVKNNTYVITLDYITLNQEIFYLHYYDIRLIFDPSGLTSITYIINYIDLNIYGSAFTYFRTFMEIVFCIILLIYAINFVKDIKAYGERIKKRHKKKQERLEKIALAENMKFEITEMSPFVSFIQAYFSETLVNSFLLISLIFSIVAMIYWYNYAFQARSILSKINEIATKNLTDVTLEFDFMNKVNSASNGFQSYLGIVAINFLFIFLKILKYVSSIITRSRIFFNALSISSNDIVSFYIFFFTVLLSFVFMSNFYFGKFLNNYSNFWNALQINFSLVLGIIDRNISIQLFNFSSVSILYIILLCIVLKFIILKILLAIVMYYYKFSLDKYNADNRDMTSYIETWKEAKEKFRKNEVVKFAKMYNKIVNKAWDFLLCAVCCPNEELAKKEKKEELPPKSDNKDDGDLDVSKKIEDKMNQSQPISDKKSSNEDSNSKNSNSSKSDKVSEKEKEFEDIKFKDHANVDNMNESKKSEEEEVKNAEPRFMNNIINIVDKVNNEEKKMSQFEIVKLIKGSNKKYNIRFKYLANPNDYNRFRNESFEYCKDDSTIRIENKQEQDESVDSFFGLEKFTKNVMDLIKLNKKVEEKKEEENIDPKRAFVPKDFEYFNTSFSESYVLQRNKYFESEKDEVKLANYYEKKYKRVFKSVILHVFFIVVLILLLFLGSLTTYHAKFHQSMNSTISQSILTQGPGQNYSLFQLSSLNDIHQFCFNKSETLFTKSDTGQYIYFSTNLLVQNSYTLTIRRSQLNLLYNSQSYPIRKYQPIKSDVPLDYMNKTNLLILFPKLNISYLSNNTYAGAGGISVLINMANLGLFTPNIINSLIDGTVTNVELEFILNNIELKMVGYVVFTMKIGYGGAIQLFYNTYFFKIDPVQDYLDVIKYICEILYLAIVIHYFYILVKNILEQNRAYNRWEKEKIIKLNDLTIKFRNRVKPEFLRKAEFMLDLSKLNDLIFMGLSIYLIILKFNILLLQINLSNMDFNNTSLYIVKKAVWLQGSTRDSYELIGSLLLICSCFKFFSNLSHGFFIVLTETIIQSKINNFIFIIILFLIQPAFFCFGNIIFGFDMPEFSSIPRSIVQCFVMFFRDFKFSALETANSSLGPLFFYLYLLILNMIIVNFFISILDRTYIQVKSLYIQLNEKYSLLNVYLFCCYKSKEVKLKTLTIDTEFENKKFEVPESKIGIHQRIHTTDDYNGTQSENLRYIDEIISKMHSKLADMKNSWITRQIGGESYFFEDNVYTTIELKHVKCYTFFYIMTISRIITLLEKDMEVIEYYRDHLFLYKSQKDFKNATRNIKAINDKYLTEVEQKESEFVKLFDEIEKLKKLQHKYIDINNGKEEENKVDEQYEQEENEEEEDEINQSENGSEEDDPEEEVDNEEEPLKQSLDDIKLKSEDNANLNANLALLRNLKINDKRNSRNFGLSGNKQLNNLRFKAINKGAIKIDEDDANLEKEFKV